MKARRLFALFSFSLLTLANAIAIPAWVAPYPTVQNITAINGEFNVDLITLTGNVTVYYIVYKYPAFQPPATIKTMSSLPPDPGVGPFRGGGSFTYNLADAGTVKTQFFENLIPNQPSNTLLITVEYALNTFLPTKSVSFANPACPLIDLLTGFSQPITCVNKTAIARFNVSVDPDPNISGILKGTTWTLDWGDGTTAAYTSLANNDIPPLVMRTHTYSTATTCNYVFSNGIKNPCGQTRAVQYIAVVHGRDIPSDGDGILQLVNAANGSTTIQVCAGTQSIITIRDNSTWNCQNPTLPGGLTPVPNLDPRNIEWLYGRDPVGAITNTITGAVAIATLGPAPQASGRFSPTPYGPASLSQAITIPATCLAGQYFRVYLKNWNKCNWTDPEYVNTFVDILVIAAPPAPTVPNKTICFGGDRTLTVTSPPVGTITWYSDAGLTTVVGNGITYVPTQTAAGAYDFWVTDQSTTGLLCISPATKVTLTIREALSQPGVISGPAEVCISAIGQVFSVVANPPTMPIGGTTEYLWTVPAGWTITAGQGTRQITCSIGGSSGSQSVSLVDRYTTVPNCPSTSRSTTVTVSPLSVGGAVSGGTTPLCLGSATGNMTLSGHTGSILRWEKRVNAGGWTNIANITTIYSETPSSAGTWDYRALVQSGSCVTAYSTARSIVVDPVTVGGSITGGSTPICQGTNTGIMTLSGYTGSIVRWEKRVNAGGWSNIANITPTYSEVPSSAGTWDYRARILSGSCAAVYSATRTIVVDPTSVGGSITGGTTPLCLGSNTGVMTLSGHTGSVVRWERRLNAGGWVNIANITTTHSEVPASAGTWDYRAYVQSGTCAAVYSATRSIVVDPLSVGGTLSGGTTPICQGTNTGVMTVAGYTGTITRWEERVNAGGWTNIANTNPTYSEVPASAGTWDYRVLVTNGSCTGAYSTLRTIVVDPTTVGGSVSGGTTPLCIGGNTGVMTLSGYTGSVVRWQKRVDGGAWANIVNNTAAYSETPVSAGTWDYRVEVKSGSCVLAYSAVRTIMVYPLSVGGSITGGSTPICYNVNTGVMTLSGHTGSVVRWEKRVNAGVWANIANNATTYSEVPTASGTWDYRAYIQSGVCAAVYSATRTIVVRPQFQQAQLHDDASICVNTATNFNIVLTGGVSPYTVNYTKGGVAQPALINYVSGTNVSTGILAVTRVFALTSVTDANGCPVENLGTSITITVGSTPTSATLTGSGNACAGATSTIKSVITGGAPPYTINYTRNGVVQPAITPYTSGTDFSLGVLPVDTYNYQITSVIDICGNSVPGGGLPGVYTIDIYANPVANAGPDQSICGPLVTSLAAVPTVGTGTWTKISGPGTVTFSNANSAASNATVSLYGTYVLRWTEVNGGICSSFDEVTLAYTEAANAGPDQQKCGTLVATLAGNSPTVGSGAWTKISGPGTVTFSNAASPTSTATVSQYGTYVLRWTITNGSCNTLDEVTIAYAETADAGLNQQKCGSLVATLAGNTPSAGAGLWTKTSGPGTVTFSNATSPISTATVSLYGTYVLRWTITNTSCNTFDEVTIAYAEAANAGPDQQICGALVATLAGNTASVGTGTWIKVFGPGTVTFSNPNSPASTATVSIYGTYILRWTISNISCNTIDEVTIAYAEAANAGPDQQKCGTLIATLAANAASAGVSAWTKISGPGTVTFSNASSPTSTATVSLYGTYVLRWTITNGSCNTFDEVTIAYAEAANAGPDQQICGVLVATLAGNAASAGAGVWTKISGPGTVTFSNAASPTSTSTVSLYGTYVLRWTITNGSCNSFDEVTIAYAEAANAGPDQQICGTLIATLAANAASAGVSAWTKISGPGTVTFSNSASPTSTATVSLYGTYVLRWTITNGSCNTFDEVTITYAEAANAGPDQQKCGTLIATLAANAASAGVSAWTKISGPGTVTFSNAASPTSTATVSLYGTYVLRWTITNGSCNTFDEVAIAYAEAANAGPDQQICGALVTTLAGNVVSAGAGAWTKISGPGTVTFSNSTSPTSTATVSLYGTYVLRWTITNGSCNTFDEVTIAYAEAANAGPDQQICGAVVATLAGNAASAGAGAWTKISGPGTVTFSNSASPTSTATVSLYGTYVLRWTITNGSCNTFDEVTIAYAEAANAGPDQTLCSTLIATLAANAASAGASAWTKISGPGTVTFSNAASPTSTSTVSLYGTYVLRWTITNGSCNTFDEVTVSYERAATAGPAQDLCNVLATTLAGNTPAVGTGTWTLVSGPGTVVFTPSINTPTATATVSTYGTFVFKWTIDNGGVCNTNQNVTINYNPAGQVDQPANQVLCNGIGTTAVNFTTTNTIGATTYSWTNSVPGIGLAASGSGNIASFTAVNSATAPVVATIVVTPTLTNGPANCVGPTKTFTITVNPTPTLSSTLTPTDVCSNTVFSYNPTSATAGTTFNWSRAIVAGITPAGPTSGINNPSETLINITSGPIAVTYQYTLAANGCSNIQNVIVNIKPEPVIIAGQNPAACSGNALNYKILLNNFTNPADNVTFTWGAPVLNPVNPAFTGGTARAIPSSANITDTFTNTMGIIGTATYTVTPYKNGCAGTPVTVVVSVGSEPVLDPGLNAFACSNTPIGLLLKEAAGSVIPTYYNIISKIVAPGLTDVGNAVIPNGTAAAAYLSGDKFTNTTGVNKTVTYRVQPILAPDCIGAAVDVVITIRPQPVIFPAQTKTVCSGVAIGKEILLSPPNVPAGSLFNWPVPVMSDASVQGNAGVNVVADPSGTLHINDQINNYSGAPITATYTVTPTSSFGCSGTAIPVVITVNPEPIPQPVSGRDKICVTDKNIVYIVSAVGGSTFTWTVDPAVGTKTFDFNTNAILIDAALVAGSGNITLFETNSYSCAGDVSTLPVQVYAVPAAENIGGPAIVCANSTQVYNVTSRVGSVYSWTVPGGAAIIGDPSAGSITIIFANVGGTISVRETNAAGCITNHTPKAVTVNPLPTATISGGGTICEGGSGNLSVDFTGTGPYTFTYALNGVPQAPVATPADPYTLNVTLAGTYTIVNVTDANCTNNGSGTATVTYFTKPTGTISGTSEMCKGGSTTLTATFTGVAPFNFTYTDGTTPVTVVAHPTNVFTVSVSPLVNTTYTLTSLTDGNTCTGVVSGSAVISINLPPVLSLSGTNLICYNVNTGAVNMIITDGTAPFGFSWTGPDSFTATTQNISGLKAGYYAVVVNDTKGCSGTANITLTQLPVLNGSAAGTNITCFGTNDGTITISGATGGTGTHEFTIDGGGAWQASPSFAGLVPGTYNVKMRDAVNPTCILTLNGALLLTGPAVLNATVVKTDVNCFGANNGSIVISAPAGGYGTYGYSINGGATWQGSGNFTNLIPGSYDVRIRDAVNTGCVITLNPAVVITEPVVLSATVNSTNVTCFGSTDGTITVSAPAGGHGTWEYSINGGGSWQASGSYTTLAPGSYNVQIRDAAYTGCYKVLNAALIIPQPAVLQATVASTNVTCNGANDGIINITAPSGGSGTYEYSINGGAGWQGAGLFNGLAPATYDVRIRDAANPLCFIILNAGLQITQPAALAALVIDTDISCFGANDGIIQITNSAGGYGTYQYSINGGGTWQNSATFPGLIAGSYDVRIRDKVQTACVVILDPAVIISEPAVLSASVASSNVTCFGANDGTITISAATGGYGSYGYSINGGTSWQGSGNFVNLAPGTYNIRIRDAVNTGCIIALNPAVVITQPAVLSASVVKTNVTCFGAADGTITINGSAGGYGTYEYTINGGTTWQASNIFTGLIPGFYNVKIRDAVNTSCIITLNGSLNVTQPSILNANVAKTNVTCNGANNGTITISSPSGGYGTYEYSVNGGTGWQSSGSFTALTPASYNVQIRDAAQPACLITLNPALIITEPAVLSATLTPTMISCFGASNGIIAITGATGGYGTYEYTINGGTTWTGLGNFTNLLPATYDVRIRDAANTACVITLNGTLAITQPAVLSATVAKTNVSCFGASDGTITISAPAGGYGTYEYSINGGGSWQASGSFTALVPGNYNVQIRDAANTSCVIVLNNALQITQPAILNAVVTPSNVTCNGANDGIINITAPTGGAGTYEYSVNGGTTWQAAGLFNSLAPATYDVRIRDAANTACVMVLNNALTITEPAVLNANVNSTNITCFGANNGTITITSPTGGYGTFEYSKDGGATWQASGNFTNLAQGSYNVQIRDKAHIGCVIVLNPALAITEPIALSATLSSTNVTCFGANDGAITISSPLGGYGTYGYTVNGGATWQSSGNFTNLAPGNYNVRIRDAANTSCVIVLNPALTITQPSVLSAAVASTNVTCNGSNDGTITISAPLGGYGTYEYTIDGGTSWQVSGNFTALIPGFYNVQIRDAANTGCVKILNSSLRITEPPVLSANVVKNNVTCFGANDGTITISSPTGGYGTYEYTINGGTTWQASGNFTALVPATYNVRIRDAANTGCVIVLNAALVIIEPVILNATVTPTDVTCFGANDGIIAITTPAGGYGTYQYSINGGTTWAGLGNFTNLAPANYDVRIRDAANPACVIILDPALAITQPAVLSATVAKTNVSCFGGSDGTITISAPAGGYGTYEYSINGGGSWQASGNFTALVPGNYNIRIRDAAHTGCVIVLNNSLAITQPAVLNGVVTPTNVTCNGANDGIINITVPSGGSGTYECSKDGGATWQASGLFNGLTPATYNVQIRDAANITCVITLNSSVTITEPAALSATLSSTNVTCFGANDGTITISFPTGGYGTFEYSKDGGTTWQASGNFTNLIPGSYNVQIRDKAHIGCVIVLNPALAITEPAVLSATVASTNVTCFGANNGTITITGPLGGYGTYGYTINGGASWQSSGNFTGVTPGTYNVRIRDAANIACQITLNPALVITQPAVLSATVASTNVACFGAADGTITITNPLGGYGTYEYSVNGGTTWQASGSFTALMPGFYNVQIRDAANITCVIILNGSLQITQPAVLSANVVKTNVTCFGANNGTITISSPTGGYGTYEYSINGGTTWQASGNFTALVPATYNVRIRDAANTGCVIVLNAALVITEPAVLSATVTPTDVTCFGASDGLITITGPSGGYGTYQYSINGGTTWAGLGNFTNLAPVNYDVRIRDAANPACVIILDPALAITQPAVLSATVAKTNVSCFGGSDGTITISAPAGGYGTYEYSINGGGSWQASGSFTALVPGTYNVRIRDVAHTGCVIVLNASLAVTQPAVLNAVVTPANVTCNGANDGIINITAPSGGDGTYEYSKDGGATWQASGLFNGLTPATYNVQIRDAANITCVITLNSYVTITEPAVLNATVASANVTCFGANNGTITITSPTGGYGTFEYSKDGGATWQASGTFTNLIPGSYNVQIRDKAHIGCVVVLNPALAITEPAVLSATVASTNVACFGANNGTITITSPLGGYGTYAYSVNGGSTWQPTGTFTNLAPGNYNVRIRDAANIACEIILNPALPITQAAVLSATVANTNVTCFGAADGTITITNPLGGYGTYEYSVNGGTTWQASGSFTALMPGFYNVQIRDAANTTCVIILNGSLQITQPAVLAAFVSKTNVTCNGGNDGTITITGATGGYGTFEYSISGGGLWQASGSFNGLIPGSYNVQIRDASNTGCVIVLNAALSITQPAVLSATVTPTMVTCFGATDGIIAISSPAGGYGTYQYSVNGGTSWQGSGTFTNLATGNYNVQIRDAGNIGCVITLNPALAIIQPLVLTASIASTNVTCFGGGDGTITISSPAGGYGTYEYSINGGGSWQASGNFIALTPGSYNILIRDAARTGCVVVLNNAYAITQPALLTATVAKTDVTCKGSNDGTITISAPAGGDGTYEYSINGGTSWQGSGNFTSLVPATYDVRIRDAAHTACSVILYPNLVITEPLVLAMTSTGNILLNCFGDNNGIGTFYGSGGTMPYTFTVISNTTGATIAAPGFNSQTFFGAGAGSITVDVTDFKGCFAQATINITQPALLTPGTIAADQVLCSGNNPAQITETVPAAGGPGAFSYQWQYATNVVGPFINIAGALASQYTPPAGATNTLYYRRMITSGFCTPVYSNVIEVKVNPKPVAILTGGETICPAQTSILKVNVMIGTGPFELDIENHGTVTGYVSGADIIVTPAATTIYKLLRVKDANSCEVLSPSANLIGTATVTVRALPAITTSPANKTICEFGMVTFSVAATGSDLTYQWYVNEGSGFNPVADGGIYFGATASTLSIFGATRLMNSYVYHVVVNGCSSSVTSGDATLTVNTVPEIVTQPKDSTICMNGGATFSVTATGTSVTYKWQINRGSGFVNVVDDANFSGSTLSTLTITGATAAFNNNIFRVVVSGTCGVPVYSNFAVLRVNIPPSVTLNPANKAICDGSGPVIFTANGSGMMDSLRWQVFSGGVWSDIQDNATYSGTTSQQMTLVNVPVALNGNQYRLALKAKCVTVYSNSATLTVNANPVVNFSSVDPINACGSVPLVINGNPAGGSGTWTSHLWTGDIGPLNNYFIQSPTFNSQIASSYTLNYKVKDSNGCYGNDDVTVIVDAPDATFSQDRNNGCTPLTVTFTKDMTGIAKFWWDFNDGSPIDSVNANPVHTFTNTNPSTIGYYNVKLTVRSPGGCLDNFTSLVTVYPAIDATFTASTNIVCSGNPIVFTSLPGASKYFWEYGDGVSGYGTNVASHLYTNFTSVPVVNQVKLTTTSFYNCTNVMTFDITVMPVPLPQFTAVPVSQIYNVAGNPVTFTNATNPGTWTWLWKFGDGATSTVQDPGHTYTALGDFIVTLVVNNANCSDSIKHTVRVLPIPPVANFDSIPNGCAPLYIEFNNTSLNTDTPGTTYRWDFGDGSTSTAKNPTYTWFDPGIYRVELIVTGPGGVSSKSRTVNAYPSPKAYFEVSPTFVFVNDEKVRGFNLSQGADSYLWEFGDGDTSKVKEPFHKYMESGVYDITLWAFSNNGCSDKYVLSPGVTVEPAGEIRFSTVFTPNKDGPIDMDKLPIGGTEIDQFFFPPIREKVINYKLQIFNRLGVLIFESHDINKSWNGYYKGKLCPQGVYVWYVEGKYANGQPFKKVGDVTLLH